MTTINPTQPATKTQPKTETETKPSINVVKTSQAEKLNPSSEGKLTYQLGITEPEKLLIRLQDNQTGGYFSKEWVALSAIHKCLAEISKPFSATALKTCFVSKSQNNAGFLAAALKAEGLLTTVEGKTHLLNFDEVHYMQWIQNAILLGKKEKKPAIAQK